MFDVVVVGRGFAGTALAWHLRWAGRRVLLLDRGSAATASRVAAGLVTPITGQRLAVSWRFAELWPVAVAFYRRAEVETGASFFHEGPAVRLFRDAAERELFERRDFGDLVTRRAAVVDGLANPHGGFEMAAARLDAEAYLDTSHALFECAAADLDPVRDIELSPDGVRLPRLGVTARSLAFCQGHDAATNPWFPDVRFNPVKGEVLTVRVPGLADRRVVHRGVWLAPAGGDVFLAGSTYDHDHLDCVPTAAGREEITSRLRELLALPFEVIGHRAAVRPVVADQRPVVAVHAAHPQLACLNGFGSKGALLAPFFAGELAGRLGERGA